MAVLRVAVVILVAAGTAEGSGIARPPVVIDVGRCFPEGFVATPLVTGTLGAVLAGARLGRLRIGGEDGPLAPVLPRSSNGLSSR